jgi:Homeodomain-like domain
VRVQKQREFRKARWYASMGWPVTAIAVVLGVSRNTIKTWCPELVGVPHINVLEKRIRALPVRSRRKLIARLRNE